MFFSCLYYWSHKHCFTKLVAKYSQNAITHFLSVPILIMLRTTWPIVHLNLSFCPSSHMYYTRCQYFCWQQQSNLDNWFDQAWIRGEETLKLITCKTSYNETHNVMLHVEKYKILGLATEGKWEMFFQWCKAPICF